MHLNFSLDQPQAKTAVVIAVGTAAFLGLTYGVLRSRKTPTETTPITTTTATAKTTTTTAPTTARTTPSKSSHGKVFVQPQVELAQELTIKKIARENTELINGGANIISLSQGVPCLPLFDAAVKAMSDFITKERKIPYGNVDGDATVKRECAKFFNWQYSQSPAPNARKFNIHETNIMITSGAIQSLFNILSLSVRTPDDVVLTALPAYGLYKHQTTILGGTFFAIPTSAENGFIPTVSELRQTFQKFKNRVRAVILCVPNNPTGAVLSTKKAEELAKYFHEQLRESPGFSLVLDEVYLGICRGAKHVSISQFSSDELLRNTFIVLSASKGLGAMPGARAAWITTFSPEIISHMIKIQSACSANACTISQRGLQASLQFLRENPKELDNVGKYYAERVDYVVGRLNGISQKLNLPPFCTKPEGTFYIWANFKSLPNVKDDMELMNYFRNQYKTGSLKIGIACVPGSAFDMDPTELYIRFSCAVAEMNKLATALDVIEEACVSLTKKKS